LYECQFFEQRRNFISLARAVVTESLEEEAHGAAALAEEVVDAIADLKIVEQKCNLLIL
jgi:hypothetical protein